jgi:hypothetical protein
MSASSAPPPGSAGKAPMVFELAAPGGLKRLLGGRKGEHRLTLTPQRISVEYAEALQAPLSFAPGAVAVAAVDPGDAGRASAFAILHRLGPSQVVPRSEGIEGWLWTSRDGSAFHQLGEGAPNLALLFSPPLDRAIVEAAFQPGELDALAKRTPLGEPALFGLLLRVERTDAARDALERLNLLGQVTDREVPPTQRRHLPDDKPANPQATGARMTSGSGSVPPPGAS